MARMASRVLSPARAARLKPLLDELRRRCDVAERLGFDPVELPQRYRGDADDAEVVALLAASLAYGRADVFKPQLERVVDALGRSPARFAERFAVEPDPSAFSWFHYRFNRPEDVAALVAAAGHLRRVHGSLGARFAALVSEASGAVHPLRPALARFAAELRDAPPARELLRRRGPRGLLHLCPDPAGAGACKRWNLFLRWMVRGPDAVDLGLWRAVPPSALLIPLDTHVARVARYLGLTARKDMSWRTAEEITRSLARIDPDDPVGYDFALCHLGMSGACPARRDRARCDACPLAPACLARARGGAGARPAPRGAAAAVAG